jgi:hypothetical protein
MSKPKTAKITDGQVLEVFVNDKLALRIGKEPGRNYVCLDDLRGESFGVWSGIGAREAINRILGVWD